MAYVAGDGNKNFVVVDGNLKARPLMISMICVSRLSDRRLAYGARRGLEHFVVEAGKGVEGGKEHGPYENIQRGSLVFRPDGKDLAWAGFGADGNWHVCVNGKSIGSGCDRVVSQITFPPDVSVPAYVGRYVSDGKASLCFVIRR